ncbi:MAG: methyltransferase domain-containing protein [Anaerolineales bacterium]|nr:methyltransferase domain-containing protein [Anaerolineales bacterium]MCS7246746.1 methyltransferase domain-containing protein [Anaerolineales bacterium]MDW8160556.1 methyltransferase domain-containing protein [Anaerolineales bacterium]MDW8448219.1 methyltransferase domain-containing protein [Anaerolineales bacterium]
MGFWRQIFFEWMYFRSPPWDTGLVPPEVITFVAHHSPGRALDLGCGTGTNAIYLAKNGWEVVGVDFSWRALALARHKSKQEGVKVTFLREDVTQLRKVDGSFDLILDIGCFHGLTPSQKQLYLQRVQALLSPEGHFLLYGFIERPRSKPAIHPEDIEAICRSMDMLSQKIGEDNGRPSAWFLIRKKVSSPEPSAP